MPMSWEEFQSYWGPNHPIGAPVQTLPAAIPGFGPAVNANPTPGAIGQDISALLAGGGQGRMPGVYGLPNITMPAMGGPLGGGLYGSSGGAPGKGGPGSMQTLPAQGAGMGGAPGKGGPGGGAPFSALGGQQLPQIGPELANVMTNAGMKVPEHLTQIGGGGYGGQYGMQPGMGKGGAPVVPGRMQNWGT